MSQPAPLRMASYRRLIGGVVAVYWSALFIATHMPPPDLSRLPKDSDKFLHFAAYAGLAYLFGLWRTTSRSRTVGLLFRVWVIVAVYAVLDELLQIPIDRHADVKDALADFIGAALGLTALWATWTARPRWWTADKPEPTQAKL